MAERLFREKIVEETAKFIADELRNVLNRTNTTVT
jgi:hypothetical protein